MQRNKITEYYCKIFNGHHLRGCFCTSLHCFSIACLFKDAKWTSNTGALTLHVFCSISCITFQKAILKSVALKLMELFT